MVIKIKDTNIGIVHANVGYLICKIEDKEIQDVIKYDKKLDVSILNLKKMLMEQIKIDKQNIVCIYDKLEDEEDAKDICTLNELSYNLISSKIVEISKKNRSELEQIIKQKRLGDTND